MSIYWAHFYVPAILPAIAKDTTTEALLKFSRPQVPYQWNMKHGSGNIRSCLVLSMNLTSPWWKRNSWEVQEYEMTKFVCMEYLSRNIQYLIFRGSEVFCPPNTQSTHSSTLARKIPWMEEPGRPQSMGSQRVRHNWATSSSIHSQSFGFSSSVLWMWELDYEESWAPKNWCFWTVVLEKTLESPLDCKEIQPVHPKGNQSWLFIGRTDAEVETPILWPPDVKNSLIWKDPDAGNDWRREAKGTTKEKMVGWHHQLNGHEFE